MHETMALWPLWHGHKNGLVAFVGVPMQAAGFFAANAIWYLVWALWPGQLSAAAGLASCTHLPVMIKMHFWVGQNAGWPFGLQTEIANQKNR